MAEIIKLSRGVWESKCCSYPARFKLFVTLLFLATLQAQRVEGEWLERGELVTSFVRLAKASSLTVKQVRRGLAALVKQGVITTVSSPVHTVVTICNFEDYLI